MKPMNIFLLLTILLMSKTKNIIWILINLELLLMVLLIMFINLNFYIFFIIMFLFILSSLVSFIFTVLIIRNFSKLKSNVFLF